MINWKVRFNKHNMTFILRFVGAILVPVLAYLGLRFEDMTTWASVGHVIIQFVSNPFLIGLTIFNALNMVPDGTTRGIGDSERAMTYLVPK